MAEPMTVYVSPKIVMGKNRGGEDLYLKIVITQSVAPDLTAPLKIKLYRGDSVDGVTATRKKDGRTKYVTDHYEIDWVGRPEDIPALTDYTKKTVEQRIRDVANWTKIEKSGLAPFWRFRMNHYVGGNAD